MDSRSLVLVLLFSLMFLQAASGLVLYPLFYISITRVHAFRFGFLALLTLIVTYYWFIISPVITPHAHVHALPIRKMMMIMKESEWGVANGEQEEKKKDFGSKEELRTVPSGPDPLHHHVNPPRQPRNQSHLP